MEEFKNNDYLLDMTERCYINIVNLISNLESTALYIDELEQEKKKQIVDSNTEEHECIVFESHMLTIYGSIKYLKKLKLYYENGLRLGLEKEISEIF